jgi:hypothetical protein
MNIVCVLNPFKRLPCLLQIELRLRLGIEARYEFIQLRGSRNDDDILIARF